MPRTKEQNEVIRVEKRKIIMEAALELFAENGYAHTSIDAIAKHAKVAKGLVYNYFNSKEDLLYQILISWEDRFPSDTFKADMALEEFIAAMNKLVESIEHHKDFYKLYTALGTQPSVTKKLASIPDNLRMRKTLFEFYQRHFGKQALKEMTLMSIFIKGFSIIYLFNEEQNIFQSDLLKQTVIDFVRERFETVDSK